MKNDPKQIITPYAFEIDPELLGLPLATPKRRLLALLIDLFIAAILSSLGNVTLALASAGVFVWIAIRTKNDVRWQNILRYTGAAFASIFVFLASIGLLEGTDNEKPTLSDNIVVPEGVEWDDFSEKMASTDFTNQNDIAALEAYAEQLGDDLSTIDSVRTKKYDSLSRAQLLSFVQAIDMGDSALTDSLRVLIAGNIAAPEISELQARNKIFTDRIDDLEDENEDLRDEIENPGFIKSARAAGEDFGLTFGWMGLYFILSLALFNGHTAGKKLLGLKVVRLNNEPIGIWYSFERFGGYAAGLATGLLGFFQVYWDANRQGIHDKIAGTVVIDTRIKKINKYKDLTSKVLRKENLLEENEQNSDEP
ncbi:RDD family protein [Gracilimonas sp.]|uniref:RDD family protein n=1 Tax=Gracilimonas sp. TaxID=1974203 RepID=UPI0028721915|nr:RDD family protein [Gracilimonas sp.]